LITIGFRTRQRQRITGVFSRSTFDGAASMTPVDLFASTTMTLPCDAVGSEPI